MLPINSENINELMSALSKAQGEMSNAIKDNVNPFFKSKYADLSSIWHACREPLSKNGLAVVQTVMKIEGENFLITTLGHASGQWIRSFYPLVAKSQDSQGIGSATTYSRRYSLAAIVGISPDDDDGEAAMGRKQQSKINPEDELKLYDEFLTQFLHENIEWLKEYCSKYCNHWKKNLSEMMKDYSDKDKFISDFTKWKNQNGK